jgi:hypothetical protein
MSKTDLIKKYYDVWENSKINAAIDRSIFSRNFKFTGPLMQFNNLDDFLNAVQQFARGIEKVEVNDCFVEEDKACSFITVTTIAPFKGKTIIAELFTIKDGQISDITAIYDAREWEKAMQQPIKVASHGA